MGMDILGIDIMVDILGIDIVALPRTNDTVSELRKVMHANLKRLIHTVPTDMFFDLE